MAFIYRVLYELYLMYYVAITTGDLQSSSRLTTEMVWDFETIDAARQYALSIDDCGYVVYTTDNGVEIEVASSSDSCSDCITHV